MRIASLLLAALSITAVAPSSHAQALHDQWFKVVASADGAGVDPETDQAEKTKVKPIVRYVHAVLNEGSSAPSYNLQSWAPTEGGGWAPSYSGGMDMLSSEENFVGFGQLALATQPVVVDTGAPNVLVIDFNGPAKLNFKQETLKSAKIKSLGALAQFSNTTFFSVGRCKLSMTLVDVSKLPFSPPMIKDVAPPARPTGLGTGTSLPKPQPTTH